MNSRVSDLDGLQTDDLEEALRAGFIRNFNERLSVQADIEEAVFHPAVAPRIDFDGMVSAAVLASILRAAEVGQHFALLGLRDRHVRYADALDDAAGVAISLDVARQLEAEHPDSNTSVRASSACGRVYPSSFVV